MVALWQWVSMPAALANRSLFPCKEWSILLQSAGRGKRGFHFTVCSHGAMPPRMMRIRPSATRKKPVSINSRKKVVKNPPPVVSLTGVAPRPNVYRDFSDGDDEPEPEGTVIQLKASKSPRKRREKKKAKPLSFDGSEDEDDEGDQVSEVDEEHSGDEDESGGVSRKPLVLLPQEDDAGAEAEDSPRRILYEKFVFQHLRDRPTRQLFGSNIHVPSNAPSVQVKFVEYIKSSDGINQCPMDGFPEFAFVGRSNVGKSSLVNLLVQRRKLALVSKKPGKTQLINHFLVNKSWYLVDLPGYGYAAAPKSVCVHWNEFTKEYFLKRKSLVMVIQLIDASIPVQQIDIDCATWLKQHNIPSTLAFTKCDRKKKRRTGARHPVENVVDFLQKLREITPQAYPWILTSCVTGQGREELMMHIEEFRNYWHS